MKELKQGIAEQVRVLAVVEPEFKPIEITIKMLHGYLVVRTNNRPLNRLQTFSRVFVWTMPRTYSR